MISTTIGIGHSSGGKGCAAVRWGETESCHRTVSAEETNMRTILLLRYFSSYFYY